MMDDDFGEGDEKDMATADMLKLSVKLGKDGFRIGKAQEEEKLMQIGFDEGFTDGIKLGRACGKLYGACAARFSCNCDQSIAATLSELQVLLYETVPENGELVSSIFNLIHEKVLALSADLALNLEAFEADIAAMRL